jgi:hypothetical protein
VQDQTERQTIGSLTLFITMIMGLSLCGFGTDDNPNYIILPVPTIPTMSPLLMQVLYGSSCLKTLLNVVMDLVMDSPTLTSLLVGAT